MSLILDALNRAREDSGAVPGLSTHHAQDSAPSRSLPLALAVLLLLALVVIVWLLYNRPQTVPVAAVSVPGQAEVSLASPASPPEPARVEPRPKPVSALARPAASATVAESVPAPAGNPVTAAAPAPDVAALYAQAGRGVAEAAPAVQQPEASRAVPVTEPTLEPELRDVDMARLIQEAENELENARLAEHDAPFINELSQQSKDRIPTVYYQRHAYSGRAGESRVLLNGKTLKVGDSPVSGMRVEEILPDSVVLRYGDVEFRLRALNSWVNL